MQTEKIDEIKCRYDWLDAIKAFAMLMVIFVHLGMNGFNPVVIYSSFIKLPLFFAASGFVFNPEKNKNIILFLKNRFIRILVPYICLSLILLVVNSFSTDVSIVEYLKTELCDIAVGNVLWFFPPLFVCNLVMCIIFKLAKSNNLVIILSALISYVIGYFLISDTHVFMSLNVVFVAYPMCVFGYYLKECILKIEKKKLIIIGTVSMLIFLALPIVYKLVSGQVNYINMFESKYSCYFYDMIVSYFGVLGFFIFFRYMKFPKFITWFGKNTIFYYAFHIPACQFVLYLLRLTVSDNFNHDYLISSLPTTALYSVITVAALVLLAPVCIFVNRYLPIIVGSKRKRIS